MAEGGILSGAAKMVEDSPALVDVKDMVEDLFTQTLADHPEAAKEYAYQFYGFEKEKMLDDSRALIETLKAELTLEQKFTALYKTMFAEFFGENFMSKLTEGFMGADRVRGKSMEELLEEFKGSSLVKVLENRHLIFTDEDAFAGEIRSLLGLGALVSEEDEKGRAGLNIPNKAVLVVKQNSSLDKSTQLRHSLEALNPPKKLVLGKNLPDREDEVGFRYAPKHLGLAEVEAFTDLYENGNALFFAPEIACALKFLKDLREGDNEAERVKKAKLAINATGAVGVGLMEDLTALAEEKYPTAKEEDEKKKDNS